MMSGGVRESLLSGLECENHATIVLDHARVRMWVIHGVLWACGVWANLQVTRTRASSAVAHTCRQQPVSWLSPNSEHGNTRARVPAHEYEYCACYC